ncbi:MAG: pur operon repressor [Clostridiales bacterium]|nr:pur operon repressor [Clostridiales bacterium]
MNKLKRNERVAAIVKILSANPNRIYSLNYFVEKFNAAKSTVSEDIVVVKQAMDKMELGKIRTITGAAGGVKFSSYISSEYSKEILDEMSDRLNAADRILPGNYLYMTDLIYSPYFMNRASEILASRFSDKKIDCIVTIETKGIPLAFSVAKLLNVPLIIVRKDSKITEGSTVSINYVSGSTGRLQRMSLAKRAIGQDAHVLIIDDFMKGGGTIRGMKEMMCEFGAVVEGVGVLIATKLPKEKLVKEFTSLLTLEETNDEDKNIKIFPTNM